MKLKSIALLLPLLLATAATPALAQFNDANSVVASIGTSQFTKAAGKVDGASSVRVERISKLLGGSRVGDRLARRESVYARDLNYLRSNLVLNPIAIQAIRASGFALEDIVALTLDGDGSAILYADDL